MGKYAKFIVAAGAAIGVLGLALADGTVSGDEVWQIVLAVGGALGVYATPNRPSV
jgi:uncharacterized membrane protein